jgi:hypothetical protein
MVEGLVELVDGVRPERVASGIVGRTTTDRLNWVAWMPASATACRRVSTSARSKVLAKMPSFIRPVLP